MDLVTHCKDAITYFANESVTVNCFQLVLIKWSIISEIVIVLEAPFDVTNVAQNATFTLSDFYGSWQIMKLKITKLSEDRSAHSNFAETLREKVDERRSLLFNNQAMIVAVYLDPRFNFKMKMDHPEEIEIAKKTLATLYERVKRLQRLRQLPEIVVDIEEDLFEDDCVAAGLPRTFYGDSPYCNSTSAHVDKDELTISLEAYDQIERIHHKNSILEFWNDRKQDDPVLYNLASIIHAIPPTQATVERAFSILGYILNPRRTRLSESLLEMILMIILNKDLVDPIFERDKANL